MDSSCYQKSVSGGNITRIDKWSYSVYSEYFVTLANSAVIQLLVIWTFASQNKILLIS